MWQSEGVRDMEGGDNSTRGRGGKVREVKNGKVLQVGRVVYVVMRWEMGKQREQECDWRRYGFGHRRNNARDGLCTEIYSSYPFTEPYKSCAHIVAILLYGYVMYAFGARHDASVY